ncbi:MAG: hypothetical protein KCHDKBKB_00083 [Elusimicrobia bacterium]|nr:hypothetical protein [Elusimicrobiota bacterium]
MEQTQLQKERQRFRRYSWSGAALLAAVLGVFNFVVSFLPIRLDTSQGQAYSLSRGSKDILKKLDDTLLVKVVFSSDLPAVYKLNERYLMDLLSEYKRASRGKIRVEYVDPSATPDAKREAMTLGVAPIQLDVRSRDRREVKECFMGVAFLYGDKREAIAIVQDTSNLEYEMSVRFKRLLDPVKPKLGFVTNGNAMTLDSPSLSNLRAPLAQLYDIEQVDLEKSVPAHIKSIWLIGPTTALPEQAITNLRDYSKSGGFVGLLLNRHMENVEQFRASPVNPGMDSFLSDWGLTLREGLVLDPRADRIQVQSVQGAFRMINVIDYPYFPWVSDLNRNHSTTKNLEGVSLPFVSPIEVSQQVAGVVTTPLAKSSEYSFLDERPMDLNPMTPRRPEANSAKGPFILGMLAENNGARLVLFGTSRFIQSEYPSQPSNFGLLGNLLDWSVQDEALIQIRSKGVARRPLKEQSDGVRLLIKYAMFFGLPLLSLLVGLWMWRSQKIRRSLLPLEYRESSAG